MVRELSTADKSRLAKMPDAMLEKPPPYLKSVIYGDAGMHKTVTSCSIGNTLLLAADPGWVSVQNHPDIWRTTTPIPFMGFRQLETLALALFWQEPPYDQYDTFVVDTLAFIQENYIDDLIRSGKFKKDTRPEFVVRDPKAAEDLVIKELPGVDDYHAAKNILRGPCRDLMKAPLNVIFLAHEREPSREELKNNYRLVRPDVTEALYKIIFRDAHLVGRTSKNPKGQRIIDFNGTDRQAAKSRIAKLNDRQILAEDFPRIIKHWQGDFAKNWEVPSFEITS